MRTIGVVNKKGGAGKTTVAVALAAAFGRKGMRVGVVDTDPNASASSWLSSVDPIDAVACPAVDLDALVDACSDDFDVLVVDSPPNDTAAIVAVARVSDLVVIPVAPTALEVDQLPDTAALVASAGTPWVVVPVRVRLSTSIGRQIRDLIAGADIPVTRNVIELREAVAQSFGTIPPLTSFGPLADELLSVVEGAIR